MSRNALLQALDRFAGSVHDLATGETLSADALRGQCDHLLREPAIAGLRLGEPVVLAVPNGPSFFSSLLSLLRAGAAPILMHSEANAAEIGRMAERCGARVAVTSFGRAAVGDAWNRMRADSQNCAFWEVNAAEVCLVPELTGVCLHPSSGSTGSPKVAVRPPDCAVAEATHYIETIGINSSDRILCTTPLSHAYAYGLCFVVSLLSSARILTMPAFSPRLAVRAIGAHGVSILQSVPTMFDVLARFWPSDLPGPQKTFAAGAQLSGKVAQRFENACGVRIRSLYGTTETGGISIASGSFVDGVGRPMAGVETTLRMLDATEFGRPLGALRIRSSSMMAGYLNGSVVSSGTDEAGWFETGDLAEIDEQGAIHLAGRQSDFINVFGMKVDPAEVESAIASHQKVNEVKVYRGQHGSGSEAVFAAVVSQDGFCDMEEIRRHTASLLSAHKCPHKIYFLPALPRSSVGKILPGKLPGSLVCEPQL